MGLFGELFGAVEGQMLPGGGTAPAGSGNLLNELLDQSGGVSGVMDKLTQAGLGDKVSSWVTSNPDIPLAANEVEQVFPPDQLEALAEKHGVPAGMVSGLLAHLLPQAVAAAAPAGAAGTAAPDDGTGQGWA